MYMDSLDCRIAFISFLTILLILHTLADDPHLQTFSIQTTTTIYCSVAILTIRLLVCILAIRLDQITRKLIAAGLLIMLA